MTRRYSCLLLAILPVPCAIAQTSEQLTRNVRRLNISLSLDREVYLPEEIATAAISISNPTSTSLLVPQPFRVETGTIIMAERLSDGHWHADEHWQPVEYDAATPTITMAPNETRQLAFRLDTKPFNGEYAAGLGLSGMPHNEGRFRLNYMYTTTAETAVFFRVREGDSMERLLDLPVPVPSWAPPSTTAWYRPVAVIREGDEYAICVARHGTETPQLPLKRVGKRYSGGLGLLKRIATSAVPIASLQAELDPLQRIAVRWTDATNASRLVLLDLDLNQVP